MPHGITLHLTLKNSNYFYLLWRCSTNLPASTAAGPNCNYCSSQHHHVLSSGPSFAQLLALLLPSLMHFSQLPHLYQVHSLQLSFNEDYSLLLLGKPPRNLGTNYYARNQLLARNSTSNTQCTTPKVLAPHQECSIAHRGSEGTNDSSSTSSDHRSWCVSDDFRPFSRSNLFDSSSITTLVFLSPREPGPDIYLINQNQTASLPSTSNSTKCFAHLMSPSSLLSSPVGSTLSHSQRQQVTTISLFQPSWAYKQAVLDPVHSGRPLTRDTAE